MPKASVGYVVLLACLAAGACRRLSAENPMLALPCGLADLRWHMGESELRRLRPDARWDSSSEMYHEEVEVCKPFLATASYKLASSRGLTAVYLSREWEVSDPAELDSIIPGFHYSCRALWGTPDGIEVFTRPKMESHKYWNVGMWWSAESGDVYVFYSSPQALPPIGDKWLATIRIEISKDGAVEFRRWTKGETNPDVVAHYFQGFTTKGETPTPTFR